MFCNYKIPRSTLISATTFRRPGVIIGDIIILHN
jgi:hypothetical protein